MAFGQSKFSLTLKTRLRQGTATSLSILSFNINPFQNRFLILCKQYFINLFGDFHLISIQIVWNTFIKFSKTPIFWKGPLIVSWHTFKSFASYGWVLSGLSFTNSGSFSFMLRHGLPQHILSNILQTLYLNTRIHPSDVLIDKSSLS